MVIPSFIRKKLNKSIQSGGKPQNFTIRKKKMALVSPGVEVTIIDQSQYLPAAVNSVPFVLLATAQNKADGSGTAVAPATTAANANKLYLVTSQRDLVSLYGTPFFYTTTTGTPIQGYELNEYGLLAAYSLLGVTNRCYILRADIDLASLIGSTTRPVGAPANGTWWLDTTTSTWGISEFNYTTGQFVTKTPIVITDSANISGGVPLSSIGNIGDYAVNALEITTYPSASTASQYFYKTTSNVWQPIGSAAWLADWPTVQGANSNPELTATDTFSIVVNGDFSLSIAVPAYPNNTAQGVATAINNKLITYVGASVRSGKLCIFSKQTGGNNMLPYNIEIVAGTGTVLDDLGIDAGTYNQPQFVYGTAAEQPLWYSGQTYPAPTGSVFIKVGATGGGLYPVVSQYSSTTASWSAKTVGLATSDWAATASSDATGGQVIPSGTVYGQYAFDGEFNNGPVYLWERYATGPTVVTGTNTDPMFTNGPYTFTVNVSIPGSDVLSNDFTVSLADNTDATDFVTAWYAAGITYTDALVTTDGAIQLIHNEGGEIIINDTRTTGTNGTMLTASSGSIAGTSVTAAATYTGVTVTTVSGSGSGAIATVVKTGSGTTYTSSNTTITITTPGAGYAVGNSMKILGTALGGATPANDLTFTVGTVGAGQGVSYGVCTEAGLVSGTTNGCKYGPADYQTFTVTQTTTTGSGTGLSIDVIRSYGAYDVDPTAITTAGTGYAVGNTVTFSGIQLGGTTPANNLVVTVTQVGGGGVVQAVTYQAGTAVQVYSTQLSNWRYFAYIANQGQPTIAPPDGTNWFYSVVDQVDIMVNYNGNWKGYKNQGYSPSGFPSPTISNATDPNGPIISTTAPTTQSDGTDLVYGDLWISTANLEIYPVISRWQSVSGVDQWVTIDNANQTSPTGVLFADVRWATNGNTSPTDDPIPSITSLLISNYLDLDAPDPALYPVGMLLFNTRRSGYNVKQYMVNYFNNTSFPGESLPTETDAWVSVSGLQANGAPYMGRQAQRAMVVQALRASIDSNYAIRDEDNFFNLQACPYYPELQPNMVVLNDDRGQTGYILGDTPMRLPDNAADIQAWANNTAGATSTGEAGLVTRNTYLGLFYPSGLTSDLSGNLVAVPPSHMMLRTFLRNDAIAYPWLAAAGTRRGIIDNATNIGYLNGQTGEFQIIKNRIGIRDTLYLNFINPLTFFTGNGLLNYGNKTSFDSASALDRTNVARLVAYIRRQLTIAARPFVFEPNDAITRQQIAAVIQSLMIDLVAKRGLYDYLVICDESNNTPARIDRNELWVDVAIEPVKAAEFIYIPVRVLNTGEIAALGLNG
jgi:hypothetical protein